VDKELTDEIISGILRTRSISGVSITSKNHTQILNFGKVNIQNKTGKKNTIIINNKTNYKTNLYTHNFLLQDKRYNDNIALGTVFLYSDNKVIFNNIKNNFFLILINSILKTMALWLIFLFFANKFLTKPFLKMIELTKDVNFDNLKEKQFDFRKIKQNEFDILKESFNKMYNTLDIEHKKNIDLNKNLEIKIQERTQELEKSILSLKNTQKQLVESEKMASLSGLVAGVAHEINTPIGIGITGITHFLTISEQIKKDYESNNLSEDEFKNYLSISSDVANQINLNLQRTAKLVSSFKQVAVDQKSEEKRTFNLSSYIDEILLSINNITKKTNLSIEVECAKDLIITSFPGAYYQIISNLIINSIRHGYDEKSIGTISIDITKEDDTLEIVYKDDGKGIKKENIKKIFDPFFTTNRKSGGTGLGLHIIYNIITSQLEGDINCTSIKGEGTTFTITLKYFA
jgi:signal transduction histidine kinase